MEQFDKQRRFEKKSLGSFENKKLLVDRKVKKEDSEDHWKLAVQELEMVRLGLSLQSN
jgi:hypothetical protein